MRKFLLFIVAMFTMSSVSANLILHESFDRSVGTLNKGTNDAMGTNTTDWWTFSGDKDYIQVVEGSLSYDGYVNPGKGNKVALYSDNGADDFRQFAPITSGKVYLAAIINVDSLKQYLAAAAATVTKNGDYFLALGDGGFGMFARLHARSVKESDDATAYSKLQLGISKNGEASTSTTDVVPLVDVEMKKDIFVVLEYEFVDGEKNDIARLYVNPTKDNKTATLVCNQNATTSSGSLIGANNKNDATKISTVNLRQSYNTPGRVYVDEIKVATAWEDLFPEGGDTPVEKPEITTTPNKLSFAGGTTFVGETYTATFTVIGKNLKGDITLASNNSELTLDKTTITKAEAESESGVVVTATLIPVAVDKQSATITLTTTDATATITSTWWTTALTICATVAEIKAAAAAITGDEAANIRFTGEAVVTYKFSDKYGAITFYLEDNTGAISVSDTYLNDAVQQGDKITNFVAYTYADAAIGGILPIIPLSANITVLSHNNDVTPQVVTLAELKANAADYLLELVKVEGVTFDNTDPMASGATIQQGENTATINLIAGNELIGVTKPAKADITGISSSTTGTVIRMRGAADLKDAAVGSGIDQITVDMPQDVEIYTLSGQRVSSLQPGVNIIRTAEKTYKVVR